MGNQATDGFFRPVPVYDPARSLLNNDHFQIGYVTNDIERAVAVFRERFGVTAFRSSDAEMENGSRIYIRSVWIGAMMYELCQGVGPGMELYTTPAPPADEFILRFHHFCYLVPDEAAWSALEEQLARGNWKVHSQSDIPGFFRGCFVEAPELGHFLEYVLPRQGLLDRMNPTPVV